MSGNIRYIVLLTFLAAAFNAYGQNTTRSPYSRFGIGEMRYQGFVQHSAMGENSTSIRSSRSFSITNPASYSGLGFTTLEAGGYLNTGTISNSLASIRSTSSSFSYFSLGVPLKRNKWGAAFGLLPYSSVGYNEAETINASFGSYTNHYTGSGGLSRVFMGSGFRIYKTLHFGLNASYIFGKINDEKYTVFPDTNTLYYDTRQVKSDYMKGMLLDAGLQYNFKTYYFKRDPNRSKTDSLYRKRTVKDSLYSTIGVSFQLPSNLNLERTIVTGSTDKNSTIIIDTTYYNDNFRGKVVLPSGFSVGYTLQRSEDWIISVSYSQTRWKEFRYLDEPQTLQTSSTYSIGGYFVPNSQALLKQVFAHTRYYAGFRYKQGYLELNNTRINETAFSAGLGIPTKRGFNSSARVQLTAEYIMRGTTAQNLIRENYFRFNIGITFNDAWFIKKRYD